MTARRMTEQEHKQGYAACDCGVFAFVWRSELLRWLPKGYHGELCQDCQIWTCSLAKLREAEEKKRQAQLRDTALMDKSE